MKRVINISKKQAIFLSGILWIGIGVLLLIKGSSYFLEVSRSQEEMPLIKALASYTNSFEQSLLMLICFSFLIGLFKGRVMLKRAAYRVIGRIKAQMDPFPLKNLYSKGYLFLIGGMMCMGMVFKWLPIASDIKGAFDFTIGTALINGALFYFRSLYLKQNSLS